MNEFEFIQNKVSGKWIIFAPKRAHRPHDIKAHKTCPFCPAVQDTEEELFRIEVSPIRQAQGKQDKKVPKVSKGDLQVDTFDTSSDWLVRVLKNKFPFAPIHEVIVLTPEHTKNFHDLPLNHIEAIIQTYKVRFLEHRDNGLVYIFHNNGEKAGQSLIHLHSQLVVLPKGIQPDTPELDLSFDHNRYLYARDYFDIFCPPYSQWPDEVWISPKKSGRTFGEITEYEVSDLSFILKRLLEIFYTRYENELCFNFYISPFQNWYLRFIPREKSFGGFELGSGIFVNTQDMEKTIEFIKLHFEVPDHAKIKTHHPAEYPRGV